MVTKQPSGVGIDRRQYLRGVGAAGVTAVLAGCMGGGEDPETIVGGTAPGFPPFEIKEGGELAGFDIELFEAVVAESDYEFGGWVELEFDALIPALQDERIDGIAAAMSITDERDEQVDFSDPYYSTNQSVIVGEDDSVSPAALGDLAGSRIGVQEGTTGEGVVDSELIETGALQESNKRVYGNYTLAVQDLENGNIDAIVLDSPVAQTFADQRAVVVAFVYETDERYGFAIREGDAARKDALDAGLGALQESGAFDELVNRWFAGN